MKKSECKEVYLLESKRIGFDAWENLSDECKQYICSPLGEMFTPIELTDKLLPSYQTTYKKSKRKYKNLVWRLTELNAHLLKDIELRSFKSYHIDHIVPIHQAFKLSINPHLIASIENLRIITAKENSDKGIKLTKESKILLDIWGIDYSSIKQA